MSLLEILALLGSALIIAKLLGGLADKVGIPTVLVELVTGIAVGNLGGRVGELFLSVEKSEVVHALSELGVLLLLFTVGLETDLRRIRKVGIDATLAAFAGVAVPFGLAFLALPWVTPLSFERKLFMAAALTATSVGITARVLQECRKLATSSGQIILGAAVIDDILGIIVLSVVSSLAVGGEVGAAKIGGILLKVLAFMVMIALARRFFLPNVLIRIRRLEVTGTVTVLLFSLCMVFAWFSEIAGLSGIIGAFALGIALDDVHFAGYREMEKHGLEELMKPIVEFLSPIFFIVTGMGVKLGSLANADALLLATVLIVCAILGKLVCGFVLRPATRADGADRWLVGFGMIPRGEVGLIFAAMGSSLHVLGQADYAAVVMMVTFTTLLAPALISWRAKAITPPKTLKAMG